ncbi:MAG: hypothetical protein PHD43_11680 [Methylococcales bacterium]|nr:hypothetical protein [Methylococcales bacterium]
MKALKSVPGPSASLRTKGLVEGQLPEVLQVSQALETFYGIFASMITILLKKPASFHEKDMAEVDNG